MSVMAAMAVGVICVAGVSAETGRLVTAVAMCALVAAASFVPTASFLGAATVIQLVASFPVYSNPFIVLAVIALTAVLAYRAPAMQSGAASVALWYLSQVELGDGIVVPNDAVTAAFLGILILASWAAGWGLRTSSRRREAESDALRKKMEDERERAVFALHGSVASSLTSVVLRSEALAMSGDPRVAGAAQLIAADARRSMREVRELIVFMREDGAALPTNPANSTSPLEAFTWLGSELRSHGFTVIESGLTPEIFASSIFEPASRICRELSTNILKYGDIENPVIIAAISGEDRIIIAIQNTITPTQRSSHMTSGIGLEEASSLVDAHGGSLNWSAEADTWRYELELPRGK